MYVILVQDELLGDYVVYKLARTWEEAEEAVKEALPRFFHVVIELRGDAE